MNAAVVRSFAAPPEFGTFDAPVPKPDESLIRVRAAALSPLVKAQASGKHYSSGVVPFIPGADGVGVLEDGQRVCFAFPAAPYGAMAERVAVPNALHTALPDDLDDVAAAALANPGMSSWAALTLRAPLQPGETVLVNGATGSAGRLAVQIARHLGAGKVIATGRNAARLRTLGADTAISLEMPDAELAEAFRRELRVGVDVILDYLWGPTAEMLIGAASGHGSREAMPRIRFVQIGSASGSAISLESAPLRSSGLELLGSGLGSASYDQLVSAIGEMLHAARPAGLHIDMEAVPLTDVSAAWTQGRGDKRLVFTL